MSASAIRAPWRARSSSSCRVLVLALGLALAGCATPTAPRYHTLLPAEAPVPLAGAGVGTSTGPAIFLEPVRVPVQVDQPQWLVRMADDSLALLEQERWASPLRDEFRLALREILARRFGAVETRSAAPGVPLWRVRVDVTRFESMPGEARLEATWSLTPRSAEAPALRCPVFLRESAGPGMPALAAAHRRAVSRLGDAIGKGLLASQQGAPAHCPE